MINFLVTHKKNKKAEFLEQAAGFPPFTRGYSVLGKNVTVTNYTNTHFILTEYTDENIIQLFSEIISRQAKETLSLKISFTGNITEIIYIRVLRTLLAFVSNKLHNNASLAKFEFHGFNANELPSINTLVFANAAQLDVLMVNNKSAWDNIQCLLQYTPVDSLYGSSYLEEETEVVFFRLWKKIAQILA